MEVLEVFFEKKFLCGQQLLSTQERYEKILAIIPDESSAAELHDRWQGNQRSSIPKGDPNIVRWEKLKNMLQSGKHKDKVFEDVLKKLSSPTPTHGLIWRFGRVYVPTDPDRCEDFDPTAGQPFLRKVKRVRNEMDRPLDVKDELGLLHPDFKAVRIGNLKKETSSASELQGVFQIFGETMSTQRASLTDRADDNRVLHPPELTMAP
ncbi:putative glycosyltransferase 2 [Acorus calamus]|uniref:Glycosyltransferase 2 n=1 Tax=Acorus calamus TaxID=4465 RepID=A0AAV9EFQ3_ACOCL|nr:putative glycosyltransferase 2 [Acorus calamus]